MSEKKYMAYGDAETVLTEFADKINNINTVIPSSASSENKLVTETDVAGNDIAATASGSSISLTDSADARVQDMVIYGKEGGVGSSGLTVTATGKNRLKPTNTQKEHITNGITFTLNEDGSFTVNGTATARAIHYVALNVEVEKFVGMLLTGAPRISTDTGSSSSHCTIEMEQNVSPYRTVASDYSSQGTIANRNIIGNDGVTTGTANVFISIPAGYIADDIIFTPMIITPENYEENGTYEQYKELTMQVATALPLRRVMKTVDLGDLDWTRQGSAPREDGSTFARFNSTTAISDIYLPSKPPYSDAYEMESASASDRYTVSNSAGGRGEKIDKTLIVSQKGYVFVIDDDYTDAAAFKEAVSGIILTYPSYCDEIDLGAGQAVTRIDTDGETVLSEPVVTALTNTEIAAWRKFRTFEGVTNITATDDPQMIVEYVKNTDNGKTAARMQDDADRQVSAKQNAITQSSLLTLTAAGWDSTTKQQTVTFAHDTTKRNDVDITLGENSLWDECGVYPISETSSGITFACEEVPSQALTFKITSMEVG